MEESKKENCENVFKTKFTHKQINSVHKNHKCESCDKSFSQARYLKKHIYTVHEGHKDHKCEFCHRSFTRATTLKNHIFIVHNV